jgi:MFS family permease
MLSSASFFGWRVVGAACVLAMFAWGVSFYGPPVFLQALHAGKGWPVPLVSTAITAHFLLGAAVVANFAAIQRRFGIVAVTRAGAALTAAGLLGWSCAQAPWQLFLAAPVSGTGWALTSGAALNAMVAPWFVRRRPAALGMAFNGASMGGVVFSPLWVLLIGGLGLPAAAALVAVALLLAAWRPWGCGRMAAWLRARRPPARRSRRRPWATPGGTAAFSRWLAPARWGWWRRSALSHTCSRCWCR